MSEVETHNSKCPTCSANIKWNSKIKKFKCDYCYNEFDLNELDKQEEHEDLIKNNTVKAKEKDNLIIYKCGNCGAEVIADKETVSTFCLYCQSTTILKSKIYEDYIPEYIIPFKNTKEEAEEKFKKLFKGKILLPNDFKADEVLEKITGLYVPYWKYDATADGTMYFKCEDTKSWSDDEYDYTQTDTYEAEVSGHYEYNNVLQDASARLDDSLMTAITPYNLDELEKYNSHYLSGYFAEKYSEDYRVGFEKIKPSIINATVNTAKTAIHHDYEWVRKTNLVLNGINTDYVMLPVWVLYVKYKDTYYPFAVNGQTGKITGNFPVSKIKKTIFALAWFVFFLLLIIVAIIGVYYFYSYVGGRA